MDRFYNSPSLSSYLVFCLAGQFHKNEFCAEVSMMPNRKLFPKQLQRKKKDMQHGQHEYLCNANGMSVTVWCDRSPIYFISTFHDPGKVDSVNRKGKSSKVTAVPCHETICIQTLNLRSKNL